MIQYRQEENPFVKIFLAQNEYRLESNILLKIILTVKSRLFTLGAKGFNLPQVDVSVRVGMNVSDFSEFFFSSKKYFYNFMQSVLNFYRRKFL